MIRIVAALLLGAPAGLAAQINVGRMAAEIRQHSRSGEHDRALVLADSLYQALPDHPGVVQLRAITLAWAGRRGEAQHELQRLVKWDGRFAERTMQDSAFFPLRGAIDSTGIARAAARSAQPITRAHVFATINEPDLVPEGTAWDPITRSVLVGSLNRNKILSIGPNGSIRERVKANEHGLASVAGIHADPARRTLWVTSNARYDTPGDTTASALFAFDLVSGAFRQRYDVPAPGAHFLNDITTTPNGTVYITDTQGARVYVLAPGAQMLREFTAAGRVFGPNGITSTPDGAHLFIADWDRVQVVHLPTHRSWRLALPDSINLNGIDGLAFTTGSLIAHHPLSYWRIVRYDLDPALRRVTGRKVFESNTPDARTSTTGEVVGGDYIFIGNSQIDRMNARTLDAATMQPVRIYRVPVRPAADGVVAVALSAHDSVALLDAQTLARMGTLAVGKNPHEIDAAPNGRRAYVADAGDTTITVIALESGPRVVTRWRLRDSASVHDVTVSEDGATVWGVDGSRSLAVELAAATGVERRRIKLDRAGGWMVDRRGHTVAIGNLEGGAVTLLDARTRRQRVLATAEGEIDAALSPDGKQVWSVNLQNGQLSIHDAVTGELIERKASGTKPVRVAFAATGLALVVSDSDSTLFEYDRRTRAQTRKLTLPRGPKVIAVSGDGRRAYISHPESNSLSVIDLAALVLLRTIPLAGTPDGVAVLERRRR